ncbi:hypothetical protein J3E72DRAFT_273729 [Bipolaris maydis]|nr:hypothetical protein J3E72DRAFT_273729 [Bipolaris maydis]
MSTINLASLNRREIATARKRLEQDLDDSTLLPTFLAQDPARMQAAMEMIADGTINPKHFFHTHPYRVVIDPVTGEQNPQLVSLLDDLIEAYEGSLPNLSRFAEGQSRNSQQPEEKLVGDFEILGAVISACRSDRAVVQVRESANDPETIAKIWGAFAKRLKDLQFVQYPEPVRKTFLEGLDILEKLPASKTRATSASELACLVHVLDTKEQVKAFNRAIEIVFSTHDADLVYKAVPSLQRLDRKCIRRCALYLMRNARKGASTKIFYAVPDAIGKAIGYPARVVEEWYDSGNVGSDLIAWAERQYGPPQKSQ